MLKEVTLSSGKRIVIVRDELAESPREWDNLGSMVCFHGRYKLGDKHNESTTSVLQKSKNDTDYISLPLYLYDHSGLSISTTPFHCRWDSGQVGFILVTKEKVRQEYGWKLISKKRKEQILKYLDSEVETYNKYLRGDVIGFQVFQDEELLDSVYGFYVDKYSELASEMAASLNNAEIKEAKELL